MEGLWSTLIVGFMGGIGLLLFGMSTLSEGLQKIAGARLRDIMGTLTTNRFYGMVVGALVTILFQSSTATTVILVGLTSASVMSLKQALGVILGADIGTTVTAQLIALKVTEIAMPIVGVGATIVFFTKRDKYKRVGQVLLGFGLLFLGLKIMSDTMYPLRQAPFFMDMLAAAGHRPILAILAAAIFTFLIHSSAAAVGIIMVLAMQGFVNLHGAIYLLFGANIGTSFTALLVGIGSPKEAQRVAAAHLMFKVIGVLLFLPFVTPFANLVKALSSAPGYQVANVHTLFNIGIAVLFLPFTTVFARFLEKFIPDKQVEGKAFVIRYLDENMIYKPSLALGLAAKEISHTFDIVYDMTCECMKALEKNSPELLDRIFEKEEHVDALWKKLSDYLVNILRQPLSREEFLKCISYMHIVNDLEHIGDIIEKNVTYLTQCKISSNCKFSEDGWDELSIMHKRTCELTRMANISFATNDTVMARKAISLQPALIEMESHLRLLHIHRMRLGTSNSIETSSLHLDLINSFLRISEHVRTICGEIVDPGGDMSSADAHDQAPNQGSRSVGLQA